jgi:hypothetical protein
VAEGGPLFVAKAQRHPAETTGLVTDLGECHWHCVKFQGLQPGTKYAYRVGDGINWSEWFQFRTAAREPEPFSLIYFGDAQNDIRSLWSRVIREAHADAPRARFMIHAGDLINRAESDADWGEWFGAGAWLNAMVPSLPTPGNHEYARSTIQSLLTTGPAVRKLSKHWRPQFTLPENGPKGLEETVYYLDYQGVRIISLNSNEKITEQVPWLDSVLQENPCRWTIVTFHHPIFSAAKDRDNPGLRAAWKPLFDKYRVDLVLTGHDHAYGRTGLDLPGEIGGTQNVAEGTTVRSQTGGTVYVVSVSGPKMYNLGAKSHERFKRRAEDTQLYQIIHVDGSELRYEARMANGELYDAFVLRKQADGPNQLLEHVPDLPERLRPAPLVVTLPLEAPPPE